MKRIRKYPKSNRSILIEHQYFQIHQNAHNHKLSEHTQNCHNTKLPKKT